MTLIKFQEIRFHNSLGGIGVVIAEHSEAVSKKVKFE